MIRRCDKVCLDALRHVSVNGIEELNKRTGSKIKAVHGYSFSYDMNDLPVLYFRKVWLKSAAVELAWFLSGMRDASWVNENTGIWKEFTEEDGTIPTAYGYRWMQRWGYDQINNILDKLRLDPTSRQQVLLSWDPTEDNVKRSKNIPCPFVYVINIIGGKLNIHLTLRSNDVWLGLPYDLMTACLLGKALANSLNVDLGELFYSVANLHMYENQYELVNQALHMPEQETSLEYVNNSPFTIGHIRHDKDLYLAHFKKYDTYLNSGWTPKVNVVK